MSFQSVKDVDADPAARTAVDLESDPWREQVNAPMNTSAESETCSHCKRRAGRVRENAKAAETQLVGHFLYDACPRQEAAIVLSHVIRPAETEPVDTDQAKTHRLRQVVVESR